MYDSREGPWEVMAPRSSCPGGGTISPPGRGKPPAPSRINTLTPDCGNRSSLVGTYFPEKSPGGQQRGWVISGKQGRVTSGKRQRPWTIVSSSIWCIPEPDCVVLMERERVQDGETLRSASSSFGRSLSSAAPGATIARYRARRRPQRGGSHRGAGNLPWAIPEPGRWRELERLLSDDAGPAAAPSTRW